MALLLKFLKTLLKVIWNGEKTIIGIYRILRQGRWEKIDTEFQNKDKSLWILGNGPSLQIQLKEHMRVFLQHDIMCVNNVSATEYFEKLMPKYYVLVDPAYWSNQDNLSVEVKNKVNKTIDSIVKKTNWTMTLILPVGARKNVQLIQYIMQNKMVNIQYISTMRFYGYEWLRNLLLDKQYCSFGADNVLLCALHSAMHLGYKQIVLFGADHDWCKHLIVTKDNKIAVDDEPHFYQDIKQYRVYEGLNINDVLDPMAQVFRSYREINAYALERNIKISNATPGSFVDAFEREELF